MKTLDEKIWNRVEELKVAVGAQGSVEDHLLAQLSDDELDELEAIVTLHFPNKVPEGSSDWYRMVELLQNALRVRPLNR